MSTTDLFDRYTAPLVVKARELVMDEMRRRSKMSQANPRLNLSRDMELWLTMKEALREKLDAGMVQFPS